MRRTMLRVLTAIACAVAIGCSSSPTAPDDPGGSGDGGGGGFGGGGATGNTTVIEDQSFQDSTWEYVVETYGAGGSGFGGHFTIGGVANSDYWRVTINAASAEGSATAAQVAVFAFHRAEAYTPSGDGPIFSIDYFEESRHFSGGSAQYSAPALRQNGTIYTLVPNAGAFAASDADWAPHSVTGQTQNQFRTIASANDHPDFSTTGSRIEFGFMRLHTSPPGNAGSTSIGGIDNFRLVLNR